jgi:hypothetical protein
VCCWRESKVVLVVFFAALAVYGLSPNVTNSDSYLSFPTAVSIIHSGDLSLDEFDSVLVTHHHGYIERKQSHYDFYPWPVALVFLPVVAMIDAAGFVGVGEGATALVESDTMGPAQLLTASAVSAAAAALVTLLAIRRSGIPAPRRNLVGLSVGLVFAFGTASWSTASRALWQHGPSMALLAAALIVADRAMRRPRLRSFILLGAIAGLAYTVRPTNAVVVVAFGLWSLSKGSRPVIGYSMGGLLVAVPWMVVNMASFGGPIPPYHGGGRLGLHPQYGEAVAANLVSPARGLLVWAPVVLVAAAGLIVAWRSHAIDSLHVLSAAVFCGYLGVVSAGSEAWWAGHSIGPRFLTDPLPMLALLAVPAVDGLVEARPTEPASLWRTIAVASVAIAVAWSVTVNAGAAVTRATNCWNVSPTNINEDPERVWSLDSPQPLIAYQAALQEGPRAAVRAIC